MPEHIVKLMTLVSGGEPFLISDYFCCIKGDLIIVVGYPLDHDFEAGDFEKALERIIKTFHPMTVSLVAPELPSSVGGLCRFSFVLISEIEGSLGNEPVFSRN